LLGLVFVKVHAWRLNERTWSHREIIAAVLCARMLRARAGYCEETCEQIKVVAVLRMRDFSARKLNHVPSLWIHHRMFIHFLLESSIRESEQISSLCLCNRV